MTTEGTLKEIEDLLLETSKKLEELLKEKEDRIKCEAPQEDEIEAIRQHKAAKKKKK